MSISDLIVVMEKGKIRQIGAPQEVYDNPSCRFVAGFLGTPPINFFRGSAVGGALRIGEEVVMENTLLPNGPVCVGIRPEGFVPDPKGPFSATLDRVEVMGRDVSILCKNPASEKEFVRAIVDADLAKGTEQVVRFTLKPHKVLVFHPESGERLPLTKEEQNGTK